MFCFNFFRVSFSISSRRAIILRRRARCLESFFEVLFVCRVIGMLVVMLKLLLILLVLMIF